MRDIELPVDYSINYWGYFEKKDKVTQKVTLLDEDEQDELISDLLSTFTHFSE